MDIQKRTGHKEKPPVKKIDPEENPMDIDEPIEPEIKYDPEEVPEEDPFESPQEEPPAEGEGP